jgi:hypothetical protein
MGSFSLKNKVLQILKKIVEDAEKGEKAKDARASIDAAPAPTESTGVTTSPLKKNMSIDPMMPLALPPSSLIESLNQLRTQGTMDKEQENTGSDATEDETVLISDWLQAKAESGLFNISTSSPTEESFKKAADNPHTSSGTLIWLANQTDLGVRVAVAKNPNSNLKTLTKLSMDKEVSVRIAVAANKNTCKEILTRLARDPHSLVAGEAQSSLQRISQTLKAQAAASQASQTITSTSASSTKAQSPTAPLPQVPAGQTQTAKATAPQTPSAQIQPHKVTVPQAQIPQIQTPKAMPEFKRTVLSQDMSPPPLPIPTNMSAGKEETVLSDANKNLLASNPFGSTSNHIIASYTNLDALPKSSSLGKGAIEADSPKENWNTLDSQSAKTAYQQQKDTVKDFKFAQTPRTGPSQGAVPISMLPSKQVEGDTLAFVLMLASRSGTPSMRLLELASHSNTDVRMAVAENLNTPKEAFYILAADKDTRIKLRVIDNDNCPIALINSLRADPDPYVAYEAKNTLKRLQQFRPSYEVPDAF